MNELRAIERAVAKVLPRMTLAGFDYQPKPAEKLEIPLAERLAAMRSQRSGDRARSAARKAGERRPAIRTAGPSRQSQQPGTGRCPAPAPRPASAPRPAAARPQESSHRRGGSAAEVTINP